MDAVVPLAGPIALVKPDSGYMNKLDGPIFHRCGLPCAWRGLTARLC